MNVRGGYWFIEEPYREQAGRFTKWVEQAKGGNLLVIEIGAGFNTPGVIRWPLERIVYSHPKAYFIRINRRQAQVPKEISDRSVPLKCGAMNAITAMWRRWARP